MKVYLIYSNSYLLANAQIAKIIQDSKNITTLDLNNSSIEDILTEAGYFSLFGEQKYLVVKNASIFGSTKLTDKEAKQLENYLENPFNMTTLIFVCYEKIDMRKKITKLIKEKYTLITIDPLKPYEIERKIKEYLLKENLKIDETSCKYIVSNCLNNYDIVMSELNKLVLYYPPNSFIPFNDVQNIISTSLNTNNFLFVDAVVNNNLKEALKLYNDLKILKVEPTVLLTLLAREFRLMLSIKNYQALGKSEVQIMHELGLMDWQFNKCLKETLAYNKKELEEIIKRVANFDLDIKRGKVDRFMAIDLFILSICG